MDEKLLNHSGRELTETELRLVKAFITSKQDKIAYLLIMPGFSISAPQQGFIPVPRACVVAYEKSKCVDSIDLPQSLFPVTAVYKIKTPIANDSVFQTAIDKGAWNTFRNMLSEGGPSLSAITVHSIAELLNKDLLDWNPSLGEKGFVSIVQEPGASGFVHQYHIAVHTRQLDIEKQLVQKIGTELSERQKHGLSEISIESFAKDTRTNVVRAACIRNASRVAIAVANAFGLELYDNAVTVDENSFIVQEAKMRDMLMNSGGLTAIISGPITSKTHVARPTYLFCPDVPKIVEDNVWVFSETEKFEKTSSGIVTLMGCDKGMKLIRPNQTPGSYKRSQQSAISIASMKIPKIAIRTHKFTPFETALSKTIHWKNKHGDEFYRGMLNVYDSSYEPSLKALFTDEVDFVPISAKFTYVAK